MTTATLTYERADSHPITGAALRRHYEINGLVNTAGEPEVYIVRLDGQYANGSVRYSVAVQRTNGSFASLNDNKHYHRIAAVFAALADIIPEYKKANQALKNGGAA